MKHRVAATRMVEERINGVLKLPGNYGVVGEETTFDRGLYSGA